MSDYKFRGEEYTPKYIEPKIERRVLTTTKSLEIDGKEVKVADLVLGKVYAIFSSGRSTKVLLYMGKTLHNKQRKTFIKGKMSYRKATEEEMNNRVPEGFKYFILDGEGLNYVVIDHKIRYYTSDKIIEVEIDTDLTPLQQAIVYDTLNIEYEINKK